MHPILVIWNPVSGGRRWGRRIPELRSRLTAHGFDPSVRTTRRPGDASELARQAALGGDYEAVFGLGGDGTLREVAVGLLGTGVPLGILPAGTTNVLAAAFGVPANPLAASASYRWPAGEPPTREMDVGLCGGRPFLMMISAGVDAAVLARTSQAAKRRWGRLAVVAHSVAVLRSYGFPAFTVRSQERLASGSFTVISNLPLYGGPFAIAPRADALDRLLDVTVFAGRGAVATLGFAMDVVLESHLRRPDVEAWRAASVVIEGEGTLPMQIDGDPVQLELPLTVSLAAERLRVLLPSPRLVASA